MEKTTEILSCVKRNTNTKLAISILCLVLYSFKFGFYDGCELENYVLYSFSHANVFHLLINLIVLWSIKNKIRPFMSLSIALVASTLPMYVSEPTMGLSGFLFASFGQMWGKTGRWLDATKKAMPLILFMMLLPNVNGILHLYTFWIGFFIGYCLRKFD